MAGLKVSRTTPNGWTCGSCGRHNGVNEGASEALLNGEVRLWCAYCGKMTLSDVGVKPARGGLMPWHRPGRHPRGYRRKPPMWSPRRVRG